MEKMLVNKALFLEKIKTFISLEKIYLAIRDKFDHFQRQKQRALVYFLQYLYD